VLRDIRDIPERKQGVMISNANGERVMFFDVGGCALASEKFWFNS
jgi:hypothetical protein